MKRFILILCGLCLAGVVGAQAPYPATINSRAARAPDLLAFAGNEVTYRVTFTDGTNVTDTTGKTPFMDWAVSEDASGYVNAAVSVVDSTNGIVDFTFANTALNYTAGTYIYEAGLLTGAGAPYLYRQGTFTIDGSPRGTGVNVSLTTNIIWALYSYVGTAADGPVRFSGAGAVVSTNADGSITVAIAGETNVIVIIKPGTAMGVATSGVTRTVSLTDVELTSIAGLTSAADRVPYYTGLGTASLMAFTVAGRSLVDDVSVTAMRATLELVIGTDVLAQQTIGIADNNLLEVDGTPGVGDFAIFAANGLNGTLNGVTMTNLNGTEIRSGTVADGRIASTIARDAEMVAYLAYTFSRTQVWDYAWGWVMGNSNDFDYVQANSSKWDTAAITADSALPRAGGTMTGDINMGGNSPTNMADPTNAQDAATKNYVDVQMASSGSTSFGFISGAYGDYLNTTQVLFTVGSGFLANSNEWQITGAFTSTVSTLAATSDYHYAYIDETADGVLSSTDIVWATNEPTRDAFGFYNGNDRCIWATYSANATATIKRYVLLVNRPQIQWAVRIEFASAMNPDASWQVPDETEGDAETPVNVSRVLMAIQSTDSGSRTICGGTPVEVSDIGGNWWDVAQFFAQGGSYASEVTWATPGASRKWRVYGEADDDNALGMAMYGYEIER